MVPKNILSLNLSDSVNAKPSLVQIYPISFLIIAGFSHLLSFKRIVISSYPSANRVNSLNSINALISPTEKQTEQNEICAELRS